MEPSLMASPSGTKPVIVLVPGAWHSPSSWSRLTPHLESAGYKVDAVSLPTVSATNFELDFTADISAIASAITAHTDKGQDVALLMHSYAGVPGASAVKGLTKADRQREGKQGGVSHLIYLAAFIVDEGVSLLDIAGGADRVHPEWWQWNDSEKKSVVPDGPKEKFYNDVPDDKVVDGLIKELRPHAVGAFYSKSTYAAWKDVPTTYIACNKDNAVPVEGQRAMLGIANAVLKDTGTGRQINKVMLESGHGPMISMPEKLSEEVLEALKT